MEAADGAPKVAAVPVPVAEEAAEARGPVPAADGRTIRPAAYEDAAEEGAEEGSQRGPPRDGSAYGPGARTGRSSRVEEEKEKEGAAGGGAGADAGAGALERTADPAACRFPDEKRLGAASIAS